MTQLLASMPALHSPVQPLPFQQDIPIAPERWHGPGDIPSLRGLPGTYLWTENPTRPAVISLAFTPGMEEFRGRYILRSGLFLEQGTFHSVPNNPAIGFAAMTLIPNGQQTGRFHVIANMVTDINGRIIMLTFGEWSFNGPVPPFFTATRIF